MLQLHWPSHLPSPDIFNYIGLSPQCRVINRAGWRHMDRLIIRWLFKPVSLTIYFTLVQWSMLGAVCGQREEKEASGLGLAHCI